MFYNTDTNEYIAIGDVFIYDPEWVEGKQLPNGIIQVVDNGPPPAELWQDIKLAPPALIDGVWNTTYSIEQLTEEEGKRREAVKPDSQKIMGEING